MRGLPVLTSIKFPCVCLATLLCTPQLGSAQAREQPGSFFEVVADAKREPSYLVILTKKGRIRRLDAMTGRATWTVTPPTPPPWRPRVLAGAVVASGQMDMSVFALDPESGRIRWVIDRSDPEWAGIGRAHCVESDGHFLYLCHQEAHHGVVSLDPNTGRVRWVHRDEPHGPYGGWRVTVFLKSVGTRLVTEFGYLDAETGRTLQRFVDMEGRARADVEWAGLPLVAVSDDGRVMLLEDGGRVTRVDPDTARPLWGRAWEDTGQVTVALMNDTLLVLHQNSTAPPEEVPEPRTPACGSDLSRLDVATGELVWSIAGCVAKAPRIVIGREAVYSVERTARTGSVTVVARAIADGTVLWRTPLANVSSLAVLGDWLFLGTDKELMALDALKGTARWRIRRP